MDYDNLPRRLREHGAHFVGDQFRMCRDAADAIEALLTERDRLQQEKAVADSFYSVVMADLKRERVECDRLRELALDAEPAEADAAMSRVLLEVARKEADELREELAAAMKDAVRYRWLRGKVTEELVRPEYINSEWPDLRTKWEFPFLYCSGPVGGYNSFDAAIDAAMGEQT